VLDVASGGRQKRLNEAMERDEAEADLRETPDRSEPGGEPLGDLAVEARPVHGRTVRAWARGLFELLRSAALVLVFFFLVRAFFVEAFKIPTSSMEGTLLAGDFLLVNKAVYGAEIPGTHLSFPALSTPGRGEIIVFHPPHEPEKHYVKRLMGLPGDTLRMKDKRLFVNGVEWDEPYARYRDPHGDAYHPGMAWQNDFLLDGRAAGSYRPSRDNWGPLVIPADHLFVLGDNRDNSEDSRYWGLVKRESVEGRPWMVYFSSEPSRAGALSWLGQVRWNRIGGLIR
jgi:signal peptidase I